MNINTHTKPDFWLPCMHTEPVCGAHACIESVFGSYACIQKVLATLHASFQFLAPMHTYFQFLAPMHESEPVFGSHACIDSFWLPSMHRQFLTPYAYRRFGLICIQKVWAHMHTGFGSHPCIQSQFLAPLHASRASFLLLCMHPEPGFCSYACIQSRFLLHCMHTDSFSSHAGIQSQKQTHRGCY